MKFILSISMLILFLSCLHKPAQPDIYRNPAEELTRKSLSKKVRVFDLSRLPEYELESYRQILKINFSEAQKKRYQSRNVCPVENQRIVSILNKLIRSNNLEPTLNDDLDYIVYVVCEDRSEPDARTSYGSTILNYEMVKKYSDEELAVVLAHELSHHLLSHDKDTVKKMISGQQRELDADKNGLIIFLNAGLDAKIYLSFLKSLESRDEKRGFYPSSQERVENLLNFIKEE